jgi:hypothetical protein
LRGAKARANRELRASGAALHRIASAGLVLVELGIYPCVHGELRIERWGSGN